MAMTAHGDEERSIEILAALLLRLLGVYFTVSAFLEVFTQAACVMDYLSVFGSVVDEFLVAQLTMSLAHLTSEFLIGMYLILGGQWVFNRLLTPAVRGRSETNINGGRGDCQSVVDSQDASSE